MRRGIIQLRAEGACRSRGYTRHILALLVCLLGVTAASLITPGIIQDVTDEAPAAPEPRARLNSEFPGRLRHRGQRARRDALRRPAPAPCSWTRAR